MALDREKYLANQLNGRFISLLFDEFTRPFYGLDKNLSQIFNLSLKTAKEGNLDYLGDIAGVKRPLIPQSLTNPNTFEFFKDPESSSSLKDSDKGFSAISEQGGGRFLSISEQNANYISDADFSKYIEGFCYLKWNGFSWEAINHLTNIFADNASIYVNDSTSDILVLAQGETQPARYLLELIFEEFALAPQIEFQINIPKPAPPSGYHLVGGGALD